MESNESLEKMNMGKLWSLARTRGIEFKGKTKKQLIKELVSADSIASGSPIKETKKSVVETKPKKKGEIKFVEVTLADGTKARIPAEDVTPVKVEKGEGTVIIKSVDGRELEASVGGAHWLGKEIEVPAEQEDEVRRLLKDGGFYFV